MVLTRPQWRSWLVRGGMILTGFAAILGLHLLWSLLGGSAPRALAVAGALFAIAAGSYTAWLFAQAKARDLWQSPLLPPQHALAAIVAGAAVLRVPSVLMAATIVHLLLIAAEVATPHATAHAKLAVREMVRGRFRIAFAAGWILQLLGIALIGIAPPIVAALLILGGLLAYEHAHVGAAQSVPLA
jgi:hypothetical protein